MEEKSYSYAIYQRFNFLWRLSSIALGFFLFGSGGILLCATVFPWIMLFTRDKKRRTDHIRSIIHYTFKLYLSLLQFLRVLNIKTYELNNLQDVRGNLIICNHPSLLDVVIIMAHLKNVQCVVNNKLWTNPFIGMIIRAANYIRNDIDPQIFLSECKKMIDRGENILIFPEGTRSVPGQKMKMCRGFANLALYAEVDIQVLTLSCSPIWLTKKSKWYDIPSKRIEFILKAGPKFSYQNYRNHAPRSIRVRALMRDIQHYYQGYLNK